LKNALCTGLFVVAREAYAGGVAKISFAAGERIELVERVSAEVRTKPIQKKKKKKKKKKKSLTLVVVVSGGTASMQQVQKDDFQPN
jgi:hypothetical protein